MPVESLGAEASSTLAEDAFASLCEQIMNGDLPPGSLLSEVEISRRLSMSRGPVREALRRLEGRKLVRREPYQRARVIALGPREIKEIFELREGLEGVACRLATETMPDDEIERLVQTTAPGAAVRPSDFDLHWEIAQRCGNGRIRDLLCDDLYHLLRLYRRRSGALPGRHEQASEEHWQIARAMLARDPSLAESLMRAHVRRAAVQLTQSEAPAATEPRLRVAGNLAVEE